MTVKLSKNALDVATSRYFMEGEDWEACAKRCGEYVASIEKNKDKYSSEFSQVISDMTFLPGGRILRNAGRPKGSLFNCFHLPIGDSIEEIGQLIKDCLILWSEGGGVGVNFSQLRPKGDAIMGKGGKSSGLVSFIEACDHVSHTIESGGSRRAAAIGHVDISHPEVMDFIDAKLKQGLLSHFNISVAINEFFLDAVEQNKDWEFRFKQKGYGKVPAKDIWDKIVNNMLNCAEPGLMNWDKFTKNNSWYFCPILGCNPCGETTLGASEVCCLGSLVLPKFITGNRNTNWIKLEQVIKLAVRFLDNIIDVNKYALKQNDIAAHNSRRIGLGVMGLAEYLFAKKVRYGSEKSISEIERLMKFIRDKSYEASVELAVEKGAFPKYDSVLYPKSSFIKKLPAPLRIDIKKYGIRNVTTLAMAPTGTISLLADVSSGIEPLFSKAFIRKDRVNERTYIHPIYERKLIDRETKIVDENEEEWFVDALDDLQPQDHFEVQVAVQKYVDGSVSKTINVPTETTTEDLSKLLLEYIRDLKGVTVYRDKSREGQIINRLSKEEVLELLKDKNNIMNSLSTEDVKCVSGSCEI